MADNTLHCTKKSGRLYITLYEEEEAGKVAQHETSNYVVIPAPSFDNASQSKDKSKCTFHPPSLTEIYKFDEMVQNLSRRNPTQKLIFSAGSEWLVRVRTSFLVGCHAMISHEMDFESVFSAFQKLHDLFGLVSSTEEAGSSVWSSMSAIFQAKQHNWIDFKVTFEMTSVKSSTILMEEYLHYASHVNGAIFTIVPGKLLFFLSPSSKLKTEEPWCDLDGKRHFGAIYYAELFAYLGIRMVVRLEDADAEETAVFERYGSTVCTLEDLGCTERSERFSLQTISRFVE
eukprot:CAMPEP_0172155352 /NCGR_PEP_ID=MMETSP1050-20130122/2579_1 /TAXON_ID=233186 /ORGANISM="Cryptomonas curvata, Strain CCAP979/52" /LENGTH=286 /DNA_ID=CAMNT_0012824243 /DNA_START=54 /DNA_END=911 /DNA_ORIENTATION=-